VLFEARDCRFAFLPCCPERRRLPWAAVTHFEPPSTVGAATRIEHRCGTFDDRDAVGFFCSGLPAQIIRPIAHRSSQFSRPTVFCRSFFWALLRANPCVRQLRGFCFPGSVPFTIGFPPIKQPLALEAEATRFWVAPRKWGKKKEKIQSCLTYLLRRRQIDSRQCWRCDSSLLKDRRLASEAACSEKAKVFFNTLPPS
jgi:hypothetical protein